MIFNSFFPHCEHLHNIEGCALPSLALRMAGLDNPDIARAILLYARALDIENTHARNPTRDSRNGVAYCGNFRISQSRLLKGTFASKDHVRPVSKRLCIIFMACSCPIFVLGRLKKKKKKKRKKRRKSRFFRFPYITLAMYFRQFVSVIGYIVTRTRWPDT